MVALRAGPKQQQRVTSRLFRPVRACLALVLAFFSLAAAVTTPAYGCALALVVAMDGSASVNDAEHRLQLGGLSAALADRDVGAAIETVGGIWFSSFEWSGRQQQAVQLPWRYLSGQADAKAAAAQLAASGRHFTEFPTALGYALGFAAVHLRKVPEPCQRKVIDVAGDGRTNDGFGPQSAYRAFTPDFLDITVNGLAIATGNPHTIRHYKNELLHGPGAFLEVARGFGDYRRAMKRKLLREILTSVTAQAGRTGQ